MTKMEKDQNGRWPKWKMTKIEDNQNGRRSKWKMTKMEDNQNGIVNLTPPNAKEMDNMNIHKLGKITCHVKMHKRGQRPPHY